MSTAVPDAPPARAGFACRPAVEWPTLVLALATYGGWLASTHAYGRWPLVIVAPLTAVLVALHGSLQHEITHGHPTRWPAVNRILGSIPLTPWLPFARYRTTHLAHHRDERLTDPLDDPESYYYTRAGYAALPALARWIVRINQTLAGRVTVGAVWIPLRFLQAECRAVRRGEPGMRAIWAGHVAWCVPVAVWLTWVCGMPLWIYVLAMAVPGTGISLIRSFAEHRALPEMRHRIAIVERSWILGPLFLFNNLHALHHESPGIPWYRYPARYRQIRARLLRENGGLVYRTYFDVARRYLFRPHDAPVHPTDRVPAAAQAA